MKQIHPDGVPVRPNKRYVSVDGDVDRLIYYYTDENDRMNILDGDKIAALSNDSLCISTINVK